MSAGAYNDRMPTAPPRYRPIQAGAVRKSMDGHTATSTQRGYGRRWTAYSHAYVAAHPRCAGVLIAGERVHAASCLGASECTDHVRAVSGPADPGFFDAANHQALSIACNSMKRRKVDH